MSNENKWKSLILRIALTMLLQMGLIQFLCSGAMVVQGILGTFLPQVVAYVIGQLLYGICYFLSFFLPAVLFCLFSYRKEEYRKGYYRNGLSSSIIFLIPAAVALNFVLAYSNGAIVEMIFPGIGEAMSLQGEEPMRWYEFIISIFTSAIVPALCEEFLFRGVILSNLLPFGRSAAILGSAFLFGLMHENPLQFLYTTVLGILLGYVYVKTKSYWACVLIHFVNNGLSTLQMYFGALPNKRLGMTAALGMEILIFLVGLFSVLILIRKNEKGHVPQRDGSFGILYEAHGDYAEYPIRTGRKFSLFFSPVMIIYVVLSVLTMVGVLLGMGLLTFLRG